MATMENVIEKSVLLGAQTVLFATNRTPDNNSSFEENYWGTVKSLRALSALAVKKGMTPLLRVDLNQPLEDLQTGKRYLNDIGRPELKLAPRLSILAEDPELTESLISDIGMALVSGTLSTDAPVGNGERSAEALLFLKSHPELPQIDTYGEF